MKSLADRKTQETLWAEANAQRQKEKAEATLVDMYTHVGLSAVEQAKPYEAILWFASAAANAHEPAKARANRVRMRTWGRRLVIPVRAFQYEGDWISHLDFHRSDRYVILRDRKSGCKVFDLVSDPPLEKYSATAAAWSSSGELLALGDGQGHVRILAFPDGKLLEQLHHNACVTSLAFSPDGACLAIAAGAVRVWDHKGRRYVTPALSHSSVVRHCVFNSKGSLLATAATDNLVRVFDVSGGEVGPVPLFDPLPNLPIPGPFSDLLDPVGPFPPRFLDNDRQLATIGPGKKLVFWDAKTGKQRGALLNVRNDAGGPRSESGKRRFPVRRGLIVTCGNGDAELWDNASKTVRTEFTRFPTRVMDAAVSPDCSWLLLASSDRTARLYHLPPAIRSPSSSDRSLPWQSASKPAIVPEGPSLSLPHQDVVIGVAFGHDGRTFCTAQLDGLVRVWKVPDGPRCFRIPMPGSVYRTALDAGGALLAHQLVLLASKAGNASLRVPEPGGGRCRAGARHGQRLLLGGVPAFGPSPDHGRPKRPRRIRPHLGLVARTRDIAARCHAKQAYRHRLRSARQEGGGGLPARGDPRAGCVLRTSSASTARSGGCGCCQT